MSSTDATKTSVQAEFEGDKRLKAASAVLKEECEKGSFPGYSALVGYRGEVIGKFRGGALSPARPQAVMFDTIYDMASITKPMTAALASLLLVERGEISLLQEVVEFFPDRKLPHLSGIRLHHLLTHTSGLPAWVDLYTSTTSKEEAEELLLAQPLKNRPGDQFEYSCLGYILLGSILQSVIKNDLNTFLKREVWQKLGMNATGYNPDPKVFANIASTKDCPARLGEEIVGIVHDGNAWRMNGISGNAGLFSNTEDVFTFCSSLTCRKSDRLLSDLALAKYTRSQIEKQVGSQSYGWFCYGSDMLPAGDLLPEDTFGHTGFTGTSVVISPSLQLVIILLTNRVYSDPEATGIRRTRRRFHNTVASAVSIKSW